jgi:hypothetical protein
LQCFAVLSKKGSEAKRSDKINQKQMCELYEWVVPFNPFPQGT